MDVHISPGWQAIIALTVVSVVVAGIFLYMGFNPLSSMLAALSAFGLGILCMFAALMTLASVMGFFVFRSYTR